MLGLIVGGYFVGFVVLWVVNAGDWLAGVGGFGVCFVFGRWVLVCVVCCYLVVVAGCLRCLVFLLCLSGWDCCCCLGCSVYGVGWSLIVLL